jgi:hypothetical protein
MAFRDINTTKIYRDESNLFTIRVTCLACAAPAETSVLALVQLNATHKGRNDTALGKLEHQKLKALVHVISPV